MWLTRDLWNGIRLWTAFGRNVDTVVYRQDLAEIDGRKPGLVLFLRRSEWCPVIFYWLSVSRRAFVLLERFSVRAGHDDDENRSKQGGGLGWIWKTLFCMYNVVMVAPLVFAPPFV